MSTFILNNNLAVPRSIQVLERDADCMQLCSISIRSDDSLESIASGDEIS